MRFSQHVNITLHQLLNIKQRNSSLILTDHICSKKNWNEMYLKHVKNKTANQPLNITSNYPKPFPTSTKPYRNFVSKKSWITPSNFSKFCAVFHLWRCILGKKLIENLSLHKTHVEKPFLTILLLVKSTSGVTHPEKISYDF